MWPIQLAFRFLISRRIFLCSLTLRNTSSFLTWSVQLIFSILLQHISKMSEENNGWADPRVGQNTVRERITTGWMTSMHSVPNTNGSEIWMTKDHSWHQFNVAVRLWLGQPSSCCRTKCLNAWNETCAFYTHYARTHKHKHTQRKQLKTWQRRNFVSPPPKLENF